MSGGSGRGMDSDRWSDEATELLVVILFKEAISRQFAACTVTYRMKNVYEAFCKEMTDPMIDYTRVKNKVGNLKKDIVAFKSMLLNLSGYGWNPVTGTVTSHPDNWAELVNVSERLKKNDISKFAHKGLKHWDKLQQIFLNEHATGVGAMFTTNGSSQPVRRRQSSSTISVDELFSDFYRVDVEEEILSQQAEHTMGGRSSGKRPFSPMAISLGDAGSSTKKKKVKGIDSDPNMGKFAQFLELRHQVVQERVQLKQESRQPEKDCSSDVVANLLNSLLEDEIITDEEGFNGINKISSEHL